MENTISKIKIADTDNVYFVEQENAVTSSYFSAQLSSIINLIDGLTSRIETIENRLDNYDPTPSGDENSNSND